MHFPSDPHQPGPMFFFTPRKCGLFGVSCEGMPKQVNSLIDKEVAPSKGSNAVINYLHHFLCFSNYGVGKTYVDLHGDNCSVQNKNNFVLWYCAQTSPDHFLITGHTNVGLNWCFGLVKQCFRKTNVDPLSDIAMVVRDSFHVKQVNIP